ncbi:MAG: LysR family transcriptional regulator, partial [Deltaproteobacteria bacterium]|nr:LysR family transcriptional regulator [Deltaproteobacteria bacterium]
LGTGAGRFKSVTKLDDLHLIIHAVEDGGGVAYLSKHVVEKQLKEGTLRAHYVDGFVHRFRRALIVREGFRSNYRCASFAMAILSVFDQEEQGV